jgi:hypothetical protein
MTEADVRSATISDVSDEQLRVMIHQHLTRYPNLTAFVIARALRLRHPSAYGQTRVRRLLTSMETDGEARPVTGQRAPGDPRPAIRWTAT